MLILRTFICILTLGVLVNNLYLDSKTNFEKSSGALKEKPREIVKFDSLSTCKKIDYFDSLFHSYFTKLPVLDSGEIRRVNVDIKCGECVGYMVGYFEKLHGQFSQANLNYGDRYYLLIETFEEDIAVWRKALNCTDSTKQERK